MTVGSSARAGLRRNLLKGAGAGLAVAGMLPSIGRSARAAAGKVVVRTGGGAYEDALRKAIFEPFTAETGIEVVSFATNVAKLVAMVEAHDIQVDVADLGEFTTVTFEKRGALEKIDRSKFTRTDLAEVSPVEDYYVGENTYATVMGYNKETFASKHPRSWAEFWDVKAFPGSRMLEDMAAEFPNLEFALLADGVAMDKLYPLDIPRAFKKLREIRPHITKWWDSGAVCAQMLAQQAGRVGQRVERPHPAARRRERARRDRVEPIGGAAPDAVHHQGRAEPGERPQVHRLRLAAEAAGGGRAPLRLRSREQEGLRAH